MKDRTGKGLNRKTTTSVPIGLEALAGLEGLPFLLTDVGNANLASQAQLKEGGTSDKMSLV